ncbi:MAG: energy-coupling factor ABC transporter ATP-binding protein [Lachnospiraceae bacterium]
MIELKQVSFTYGTEITQADESGNGIRDLDLTIAKGEFLVLTGSSGCGKTTVTRLINGLIPHYYNGVLTGSVTINGEDISKMPISQTAKTVGSVFQNPKSQFFNVDTTSELAFALENQGVPVPDIERRIEDTVKQFHVEELMDRSLFKLSGGEKQKIACASVAVAEPDVIVLDEPSSNLDIHAIREIKKVLGRWKQQGKTIIIAEHRLYFLRELADRMLVMEQGRVIRELNKEQIQGMNVQDTQNMGIRPFRMEELHSAGKRRTEGLLKLKLTEFTYRYSGSEKGIQIDKVTVNQGSIVAVIGRNGAGKSTFAKCLCGLEKKCAGTVQLDGRAYNARERLKNCYLVMQDVNHQLFTESVLDEVLLSLDEQAGIKQEQKEETARHILEDMDLSCFQDVHPMALSGGQKQRTAIASAIASKRSVIIFDEPTSGLDYLHMNQVAENLRNLSRAGKILFVITHDLELIMKCCTDILHFENGRVEEYYELNEEMEGRLKQFFVKEA